MFYYENHFLSYKIVWQRQSGKSSVFVLTRESTNEWFKPEIRFIYKQTWYVI